MQALLVAALGFSSLRSSRCDDSIPPGIPAANFIRFRLAVANSTVGEEGDEQGGFVRNRRLGLGEYASSPFAIVEGGVARQCGIAFDARFKEPSTCPFIKPAGGQPRLLEHSVLGNERCTD